MEASYIIFVSVPLMHRISTKGDEEVLNRVFLPHNPTCMEIRKALNIF